MSNEIARREFTQMATAIPLLGIHSTLPASPKQKPLRFQVRCHQICIDGTHITDNDWQLRIHVRVIQRKRSDIRYWKARVMEPTDDLVQVFQRQGISVERRSRSCWLTAERVTLRNGIADLFCLLDLHLPPDRQDKYFFDPQPERWGEYTVPNKQIIKRFWIGES